MSDLRQRIADLPPDQRAILESRLMQGHAARPSEDRIARRPERTPCPLSFAQQRLWFLDQMHPETPVYTIAKALRLHGPLDVAALRRALDAVVERHEVLRTTFVLDNGVPVQVIADRRPVELAVVDLRDRPAADREIEASRRLAQEARRPYDLSRDAMLRALVLRLGDRDSTLLLTVHHIASDGWSMGILARELSSLYDAHVTGRSPRLPELPVQYADYAVWQRQWLQGARLERQLGHWTKRLAGAPALLELPGDRPRPPVQSHRGARHTTLLPTSLGEALQAVSRREGATFFMTLLAAFQALLHRYTGQEDLVVGSPIANRDRLEIEGLIGCFVDTLVLRTDLAGDPTFRELLARVRAAAPGAYAHHDLPFERLVEALQPARTLSSTPLFQVMFVLQNAPPAALELTGLTATPLELDRGTAMFDLTLSMEDTAAGLRATLEYSTDLFDAGTTSRMLGHWQRLLEGVAADPGARVSALPLLTHPEREQLLVSPRVEYPADACLSALFEHQVERTPEAVAVVCEGRRLTYAELNRRANQLAHHLRALGVGPDVLVAICAERSLELVIAVLGILKAGGAYVPLDPAYPTERLAFMLDDARVPVLLTQLGLVSRMPPHGARVVCLDSDWETIAQQPDENPTGGARPDDLAYVMYTSGSTGVPKGVLITHNNVVRLFRATNDWFRFDDRDVWSLFHSYAFDFSVWEFWGALLHGGRLVIVPLWVSRAPDAFYALLQRERVTILNQTPSAFRHLMQAEHEAPDRAGELALRLVIFGGEALDVGSLRPWFARHGDERPRLVNMYGITETTVHVTYRPITITDMSEAQASPIGVPIPDLQIHLLDSHLNPVPIGIPGELHVGGAGLARGYLNRPELTAERFIPSPFGEAPGARLYKSGDLARYLPDGCLDFLGRRDNQVKLRGFRVELGEIEAVLSQYPTVRETVVMAREDIPGDTRLVAYLVTRPDDASSPGDLRRFLKAKLPEYMVPATFVRLDTLPLTPHGKVDRKALPSPAGTSVDARAETRPPTTPTERLVAGIWRDVLGVERVNVDDNFFELGGHSLLATQIVTRIQSALGLDLPVRALFDASTVAGLATLAEQQAVSRARPTQLDRILAEAEQLSPDEAQARLDGMSDTQGLGGGR